MSTPISAFARYSQEASSPPPLPQTDSVLSASRKRKRVSVANTNGHSQENQINKNRSKSLQPSVPTAHTNGQSHVIEQPSTTKKAKILEKKFLSPAYPTPHPQRRVIVSASRPSPFDEPSSEENDEMDEEDEDEDESPLSAWLHDHVPIEDSTLLGQHLFGLLIDPIPVKQFVKQAWQRETLLVQRKQPIYYNGLFSTGDMDDILRENTLEYGENIDLTFYNPTTSKKERHNPEGLFERNLVIC
jgi:lysine-specific demethylase/histidyl-hydroxylase NO66